MKAVTSFRVLVVALAAGAALALLAAGPGYRWGAWSLRFGIGLARWSAYLGVAALVLALVGLAIPRLRHRHVSLLAAALVVSGAIAAVMAMWATRGQSLPRIHDITTDSENPPAFVAVLPLRAGAENKAAYDGREAAEAQRKAYPDIGPLVQKIPPQEAFARARAAAQAMGWEIVASDPAAGRIEATASTAWFGFKDDIVIRVSAVDGGSRVDVRSKSRVGRSDFGTNARRVRAYLEKLRAGAADRGRPG